MCSRESCRIDDLCTARLRAGIGDIVINAADEEVRFLRDDRYILPQVRHTYLRYRHAVNAYTACSRVVQTHEKVHKRRFSRAGISDYAERFAGRDAK